MPVADLLPMSLASLSRALVAGVCALSVGMTAALAQSKPGTDRSDLSVAYLESRQAMVEARKDLPPETRTKLVNLYQRAIADVERTRLTREETARLREALRAAPLERRRLTRLLDAEQKTAGDAGTLPDVTKLSDDDFEHLEAAARAQYEEAQLQVDRLEAERDLAVNRPYTLAQEQDDARKALDQLRSEPPALAGADSSGAQAQAQQLATRARLMAMQAELERLAAESAYLPAEQRILELERDLARVGLQRAELRAKLLLQAAVSRQRADADRALAQAARSDSLAGPVRELAMENAKLKGQLVEPVLEQTLLEVSALRAQAAEIDARSDAIRRATGDRTLRSEFVEALLDRMHSLPTAETFARQRQARSKLAAATFESNLRNTRLLAQVNDLDVATTLALQAAGLPDAEAVALRPAIRQQLAAKRELLIRLDEQEKALLRSLREAADAEQAVLTRSAQARDEAIRLLVWIPLDPLGPNSLVNLRLALEWALSPGNWRSTGELLLGEATARPYLTAGWALLVVLLYVFAQNLPAAARCSCSRRSCRRALSDRPHAGGADLHGAARHARSAHAVGCRGECSSTLRRPALSRSRWATRYATSARSSLRCTASPGCSTRAG